MIHQYQNNGYNIVLDVNSGAAHVVDQEAYDVIGALAELNEEHTPETLKAPETAAYLCCIAECGRRIRAQENAFPPIFNPGEFSGFVQKKLSSLQEEVIEVFAIDEKERIRMSRRFSCSLPDRVQVRAEEIGEFLARHKPAGIVIAHNHPTAPAGPSVEDDKFTAQMQLSCSLNGVRLYDHIIVGTDGTYSYFLVGRMEEIRRNFNVDTIVGEKLYRV